MCVGGVCWNGAITRIVMLSVFMKNAAEDQSSLPEVFFRQQGQEKEEIELQIRFVSLEGGVRLCDRAIVKILYVCAHVYVSLGGLSGNGGCGQAFRLATQSKHRGLTFLSSVSADKSGLPAALAASRYLVTFQTVGVGGLSQARPGWEGIRAR